MSTFKINPTIKTGYLLLGCDKNRVDAEKLMAFLQEHGFRPINSLEEAEVIIVNTCSFIQDARQEAVDTILEAGKYKTEGSCKLLVVTGCMAQMYREEVLQEIPEVDLVVGLNSYSKLPQLLRRSMKDKIRISVSDPPGKTSFPGAGRINTTPPYSVYLKISEGCNNRCNYCVIPYLRGPYREYSMSDLFYEARDLVKKGAREINLVAQDTSYYGYPGKGESNLPDLLNLLSRIKKLDWIRVLYTHPAHINERLIRTISKNPKVCSYIDVPLQHVSTGVLQGMGRPYDKKQIEELIRHIKKAQLTIRTTFMLGFPGEKEEDFNELLSFIKKYPLDRVGAFLYSPEKGTPAAELKKRVPVGVQKRRYRKLMKTQKKISYLLNFQEVGKTHPVLIEETLHRENGKAVYHYRGRTPLQAPEVDGCVYFTSAKQYECGEIVYVMVTSCNSYDLFGNSM